MLPPCKHFLRHFYYQMYRKNRETDQVNERARACNKRFSFLIMTLEISKSCLTFFSLSSYYSSYSCSSCSCSSSFCVLQEKHAVKLNFIVHKPQAALMLSTLMEKEATNLSQSIVT